MAPKPEGTLRFFGEPWGEGSEFGPVDQDVLQVETPVGAECAGTCRQRIEAGQRGYTMPGPYGRVAFHLRCMVHDTYCPGEAMVARLYGPSAGPDPHGWLPRPAELSDGDGVG